MPAVLCEQVAPGMRATERCVSVRDVRGRLEWLLVEQDFLAVRQKETYLPIGVIQVDRDHDLVLVEFPHEAATGGNRVWVRSSDLIEMNGS
jgi:hypothetical protein